MVRRALRAMALVPVVLVATYVLAPLLDETLALVVSGLAGLYVFIAGFFGTAFLISGGIQHRRTIKRLKAFDDILELPEARLVRD